MQRRQFLSWTGASLAAMTTHPWLSGCRQETSVATPDASHAEPADLDVPVSPAVALSSDQIIELDFLATVERARSLGRPVLVFVAPKESTSSWELRQQFADFLKCADDDLWRDLALCELACASVLEISTAIPGTTLPDSPLFALVEHHSGRSVVASTMDTPSKTVSRAARRMNGSSCSASASPAGSPTSTRRSRPIRTS